MEVSDQAGTVLDKGVVVKIPLFDHIVKLFVRECADCQGASYESAARGYERQFKRSVNKVIEDYNRDVVSA